MTDKDLKHLNRGELLQMLITQIEENATLKEELADANKRLEDKMLTLSEAGNIAEAVLKLNGIFEIAQVASQQYMDNIKALSERQDSICKAKEEEAQIKADEIIKDAEAYSRKTRLEADNYWDNISNKVKELMSDLSKPYSSPAKNIENE